MAEVDSVKHGMNEIQSGGLAGLWPGMAWPGS